MSKTHYLGALGLTGLTAWYGLVDTVNTNEKDTVVVSGAAGATGSKCDRAVKTPSNTRQLTHTASDGRPNRQEHSGMQESHWHGWNG